MPCKVICPPGYISLSDLSREWNCQLKDIHKWVAEGLPCIKQNGKLMFNLKEAQAWYRGEVL